MIATFYLILIIGTNGYPTPQSSIMMASEESCISEGERAVKRMPLRFVEFICVKGVSR